MICNHCGTENQDGETFCAGCGHLLQSAQNIPSQADPSDERRNQQPGRDDQAQMSYHQQPGGDSWVEESYYQQPGGDSRAQGSYYQQPRGEDQAQTESSSRQERYDQTAELNQKKGDHTQAAEFDQKQVEHAQTAEEYNQEQAGQNQQQEVYQALQLASADERAIPDSYKPIKPWGYVGYTILFSIPLVGFIFLIVYSTGSTKNVNLRNFARAYWCWILLAVLMAVIAIVLALLMGISFDAIVYTLVH